MARGGRSSSPSKPSSGGMFSRGPARPAAAPAAPARAPAPV